MTETKPNPIVTFLATKTGISSAILTVALPIVVGFAVDQLRAAHHFKRGEDATIEALRKGTAELDGKTVQILTEADAAKLEAYEVIMETRDEFNFNQAKATGRLEGLINAHSRNLPGGMNYAPPPETDWGRTLLPPHGVMRYNNIAREREADGSPDTGNLSGDQPGLAGYPAIDAPAERP